MQIIFTPTNGKLAVILDTITGEIIREIDIPPQLNGEKNRPYGITRDSVGNWYFSNWNRIGVFNEKFKFLYAISNLPENIHQIQYDEASDELWVCATSIDSLLSINLKAGFMRRFSLVENSWVDINAPGSDTQHFSSLHWYGSNLYVLAHKFGMENSVLWTYDRSMFPQGRWVAGWEAHSICRFNGQIFILDSVGGRMLGTNGYCVPLGDVSLFNAKRDENYDKGMTSHRKYARGMAMNNRGIGVISVFDFGNSETRTNGDALIKVYNVPDKEFVRELRLTNVGNIQDIQIYHEPELTIHKNIDAYKSITDELDKFIKPILEEKYYDSDDRMPYDPNRQKPNFKTRFATLINDPIDYAAQKNLKRLTKGIEIEAEKLLNQILPQRWSRSGGFWYPALNGFMDWHSNCEAPGPRIYLVWCAEANKSKFYFSEDGKTVSWVDEPAGWSINAFNIGDKFSPYWHAVDSGGTDRISFGFKIKG